MKTEGQIRQRLKQLEFRVRKDRLTRNFTKSPETCKHNALPYIPEGEPDDVYLYRVCTNPERQGCVCDDAFGGQVLARECPLWTPIQTEQEVKDEFKRFLTEESPAAIAREAPIVAALRWVLETHVPEPEEETPSLQENLPKASFWDKIKHLCNL